jgi:hypothetical protein
LSRFTPSTDFISAAWAEFYARLHRLSASGTGIAETAASGGVLLGKHTAARNTPFGILKVIAAATGTWVVLMSAERTKT